MQVNDGDGEGALQALHGLLRDIPMLVEDDMSGDEAELSAVENGQKTEGSEGSYDDDISLAMSTSSSSSSGIIPINYHPQPVDPSVPAEAQIVSEILVAPSDERIVRDLQGLSEPEREQVWADMSGDAEMTTFQIHPEPPDFCAAQILDLAQQILAAIDADTLTPTGPKKPSFGFSLSRLCSPFRAHPYAALEDAYREDLSYVLDPVFLRMFLRADHWDVKKALKRIALHFTWKQKLFGEYDCLARDIRWTDLSPDDREAVESGGVQVLNQKDRTGRYVFFSRDKDAKYKSAVNFTRSMWYMNMSVNADEQHQRIGHVGLSYQVGDYPMEGFDFEMARYNATSLDALPSRLTAVYVCYSASAWKNVADALVHFVSPFIRVRMRSIFGSHHECKQKLAALGIPIDAIPISDNGDAIQEHHMRFLGSLREREQAATQAEQRKSPHF